MRYELRRYRCEISFDILLLGGVKIIFYYWEGVRSVRYELRSVVMKFFDILLLGEYKNNFLLLGRSEDHEI